MGVSKGTPVCLLIDLHCKRVLIDFFWYLICGRVFPPCNLSIFTTFTFRGYMTMLTSCLEPVFAVDVLSCSWMNYTKLTVDKPLTLLCFSSYIVYVHCIEAFTRMCVEIPSYIVYVHCSEAFSRMCVEILIKITILLYYLQTNWTYCRYNVIR